MFPIPTMMMTVPVAVPMTNPGNHSADPAKAALGSVFEVAEANPQFSTLVAAIKAAGMTEALNGKGPFTVFAPTNTAFAALATGTLTGLLKPENKAKLKAILGCHVIASAIHASALKGKTMNSPPTLQGGVLAIDGTNGVKVNDAHVSTADVKASNGVIHIIDKVLMPAN